MNDPQFVASGAARPGTAPADGPGTAPPALSRATVLLLAVVCGAAVANIYYAQPLLPVISRALGVSQGAGGLVITVSQIGYALSLALLVPLGDVLERRRLVTVLLGLSALALLGAAASPSLGLLLAAIAVIGATSAVAQIVVPMAASLAPDHQRGSAVGTVMSGLLIGIMIARTVAGVLAQIGDWQLVFVFAAVLMAALAVILRLVLRPVPRSESSTYPELLRSVPELVRGESLLRRRMALAAVGMGCFTVLWTASSFLLAGPPYEFGPAVIGLFGLAGVVGAAAAAKAGRLADRGHGRRVTTGGLVLLAVSWPVLAVAGVGGPSGLIALTVGIIALNLAQQALLISHQSAIYRRVPHARSRVTTALMVSAFAGATVASALTAALYPLVGWLGVSALGLVIALAGAGVWILELVHPSPAEPPAVSSAAVPSPTAPSPTAPSAAVRHPAGAGRASPCREEAGCA